MKRTRKWAYVEQEAKRLAAMGLSASEIGQRISVTASQVRRWFQSGQLVKAPRSVRGHTAKAPRSPEQWARDVRASYQLDATDDQRVTAAEICLKTFHDTTQPMSLRLQAMARFDAIAKNLNLVAKNADEPPKPAEEPKVKPEPMRRTGADPRTALLTVVK